MNLHCRLARGKSSVYVVPVAGNEKAVKGSKVSRRAKGSHCRPRPRGSCQRQFAP